MLHQKKLLLLTVLFTALVSACSKSADPGEDDGGGVHVVTPNDTTAPVLTINTPTANQVFTTGNAITISGNVSDDYGLYQGYIRITNDANGFELRKQAYEIHGIKSYNFSISYTPVVSVVSGYTVTVSFEDHGTNVTTRSVKVKINP
jgi:DNA/RNA endonuclease YhcR with UshA esterase domain